MIYRLAASVMALMLLMAAPVSAGVYKCTDAGGRVQYTDTPCGESATAIRKSTAPAVPPATHDERMQKTRRLLDAMEAERNEEKRNAAQAKAEKEKRKRNCGIARERYRQLTSASRLYDLDEEGNRVILNDPQRAQVEARAKADVEQWCD
jgi:CRP-like cAMP-binding protein